MSSKKVTEAEFYERAFLKHRDKYDYSKSVYVNTGIKICIICHDKDDDGVEHGEFWQTPANHMKKGCVKCGVKSSRDAKRKTLTDTIARANIIHNNKYDYSKLEDIKIQEVNTVICPEHGEFKQSMNNHINNKQGCPVCAQLSRNEKQSSNTEEFIEKAIKLHGDKYDYSLVEYNGSQEKISIICLLHGEFKQTPCNHINKNFLQGCPICANKSASEKLRKGNEDFINEANVRHNFKYDYSKINYINRNENIIISCPMHGEFEQSPSVHLKGTGCPMCSTEARSDSKTKTNEEFIEQANKTHKYKYDYSKTKYVSATEHVEIICPEHGPFFKSPDNHLSKEQGCPKCSAIGSKQETFIKEILDEYKIVYKNNDRQILEGKELDFYIPDKKIGIELNGLYWHSEKFIKNSYHLDKLNRCNEKDIKLIQFFEDEVNEKPEIVKSMILNIIGETKNKIFARKCVIKEITYKESISFLNENHMQGNCMSLLRYGLFYNNELVSLMTFGRLRANLGNKNKKESEYELLRFCNKLNTSVTGGASKLLKYFIEKNQISELSSYCDRRFSSGNLYEKLGFDFIHNSKPNYFYMVKNKRENRFKYRKDMLVKEGFDPSKSESEIMKERGINRIYDCGTKLYKLIVRKL